MQFSWYSVPAGATGILMFLTGLFIYLQNRRSPVNISFFLICLCGIFWLVGIAWVYATVDPGLALTIYRRVSFLGVVFISSCIYYFSVLWLGRYESQRWVVRFFFAVGFVFYLVGLVSQTSFPGIYRYFWGFYPMYGPVNQYFLLFFFVALAAAFYNFVTAYRKEPPGLHKKQILLITMAFIVAFFGSSDFLSKLTYRPVYPLGFLCVFVWILIVAYAIIRYKTMEIETVIHKTLMWIMTSLVAVVPFAAFIYWTQRLRDPSSAWGSTLYYLVTAITFYFYFRAIQPRLDHLFQRQRANLLALFTEFSKELVHLKNLRDLLQSFARMLRRRLYVRRLSVYLLDEKKNEFVPAIAKGLRNLKSFPSDHPFLTWMEKKGNVVVENLVGADPEVAAFRVAIEDYFKATQATVAVPFVLGGKLIGVAHLGRKANLRRYGFREVQFLAQLKSSMTIAFSNSMRYEDIRALSEELRRWNVELEKRVEDRTRELVRTQEQLIQAEKLATLGTLAGGVAHEINNPLTAVLTNAQILKMTATEDVKESLDLIEEGAKRCQMIVQKLMKYARKTAEEAPHKPVDLNEVVKGTCSLLGFQFQQENIRIEMKLGRVPLISGIANELEQVLTNLLVNARDAVQSASATPHWTDPSSGGKMKGMIVIETRKAGDSVELVVSDNGIGISRENQKKIFDPFFTTKDVGAGTGLGLAVSFGILKRHNAVFSVDSAPGEGTTFVLRFPLTPVPKIKP